MNKLQAEKIVEELNAILMNQPLAKAVEDSRFEGLQQRLKESEWRTIIDEFQIVDGKAYGKARLVEKDSMEAMAIYGRNLNRGTVSCSARQEGCDGGVDLSVAEIEEELSTEPLARRSPEQTLWYGCRRKFLFVEMQVSERAANGEWRSLRELKPFKTQIFQNAALPKLIFRARRKFGMDDGSWKIAHVKYDNERFACQLESSSGHVRQIMCVVKWCRRMKQTLTRTAFVPKTRRALD